MKIIIKTFTGHAGRPGQVGGSVPRDEGGWVEEGRMKYPTKVMGDYQAEVQVHGINNVRVYYSTGPYKGTDGKTYFGKMVRRGNYKTVEQAKAAADKWLAKMNVPKPEEVKKPIDTSLLLDDMSKIKARRGTSGWFINSDDKLVDVTEEVGGGTNDHIGYVAALDNPEILGIDSKAAKRFSDYEKKIYGENYDKNPTDAQMDKWYDEYSKLWGHIQNGGNTRVRVFDHPDYKGVSIQGLSFDKKGLRKLQEWVLKDKVPGDRKFKYSWETWSGGGIVDFTYDELMAAQTMRRNPVTQKWELMD